MSLTPDDVRNAYFSKPRIGERGYCEAEVDILLELIEDELIRHIEEKDELRRVIATLRERTARHEKADAELRQWDAELRQWDAELGQHENELRQFDTALQRRAGQLRQREAALQHKAAELRQHELALAHKTTELRRYQAARRTEAALVQRQGVVHQNGTVISARVDQQRGAVSEEQRIMAIRTIAGAHGKHDLEWMAIRSVADSGGNEMTETVKQQWTRTTGTDPDGDVTSLEAAQMRQLQQENAELIRANDILKAAAARFAVKIQEHPLTVDDLVG